MSNVGWQGGGMGWGRRAWRRRVGGRGGGRGGGGVAGRVGRAREGGRGPRRRLAPLSRPWHSSGHRLPSLYRGSSIAPHPVLALDLNTHLAASPPRRTLRRSWAGGLGDGP